MNRPVVAAATCRRWSSANRRCWTAKAGNDLARDQQGRKLRPAYAGIALRRVRGNLDQIAHIWFPLLRRQARRGYSRQARTEAGSGAAPALEDRQIAGIELVHTDEIIADGLHLARQQRLGRSVLFGGAVEIDDGDTAIGLQRGAQLPQQVVRLGDLVVHVDKQRGIDAVARQARVRRRAENEADVAQPGTAYPGLQFRQVARHDVLREDDALRPHLRRDAHGVIAGSGTDVGDVVAGLDPQPRHHLCRFAGLIAVGLIVPLRADDARHRTVGKRKGRGGGGDEQGGKGEETHDPVIAEPGGRGKRAERSAAAKRRTRVGRSSA